MRNSNRTHALPSSNLSGRRTLADCTCEMLMAISQEKKIQQTYHMQKKWDMVSYDSYKHHSMRHFIKRKKSIIFLLVEIFVLI